MYDPYVNVDEYKNISNVIPEEDREKFLRTASRNIDTMVFNRITDFDKLTTFQQEIVKESVCMQADFNFQYGDFINSPISGYSAGSTSVTFSENLQKVNGINTSNDILNILKQTGLMVRII